MKKLLLLRHAKSSWEYSVEDYDRPLSEKGINAINKVSLKNIGFFKKFQLIMTSPANRALHTSTIFTRNVFINFEKLRVVNELYTFDYKNVVDYVYNLDNAFSSIVLIGHNPAFSYAAEYLSDKKTPELKTSDWIMIEFKQKEWSKINNGTFTYESKKN
mgnify:FL=1|tara:strand:- start:721 stop:1197 length:477 start_codon:yes stop_codon:yes gene_type:complete